MKKLTALFMAIVMMMAMATTASAAGTTTVTIEKANVGTYKAYRVLEVHKTVGGTYYYKADADWKTFLEGLTYVSFDDNGVVSEWNGTAAAFAEDVIDNIGTKSADAEANVVNYQDTATLANLENGYYVVQNGNTTMKPLVFAVYDGAILDLEGSLNPTGTAIKEKDAALPTINKVVDGADTTVAIGDTINYKVTIETEADVEQYSITDEMPNALTPVAGSVVVKYKGVDVTEEIGVTVNCVDTPGADITVTIDFTDTGLNKTTAAHDVIEITYSATVNANATGTITNSIEIKDVTGSADVKTFSIQVTKVNTAHAALDGAEFKLYRMNGSDKEYAVVEGAAVTGWDATGTTLTTTGGVFTVNGLDVGTSYLEETKAPDGYIKLAAPVEVVVADGAVLRLKRKSKTMKLPPNSPKPVVWVLPSST